MTNRVAYSDSMAEGLLVAPSKEARRAWSSQDAEAARKQGWGLILLRNSRSCCIVKTSRPKKRDGRMRARDIFDTDEEARAYVDRQCDLDEPLAVRAIATLARWSLT